MKALFQGVIGAIAGFAALCEPVQAQEPQAQPPVLPKAVHDAFVQEGYRPTIVIIVLEGDDHEVFEVPGVPLIRDQLDISRLKLPEVTIQDIGSKLTCSKYGCVRS